MTDIRMTTASVVVLAALFATACSRDTAAPAPSAPAQSDTAPPTEEALSALSSGIRLMEQFQHPQAEERFLKALAQKPRWVPAQANLAIAQMNQLDAESATRAEASAREALRLAPGDARAEYVLGYVLGERLGRFADALPHLRAATDAAPGEASAWFQRGRAAEEASRAAAEAGNVPDAATLKKEARDAYEKALALDPKSLEANYRLGRLLLESEVAADATRGESLLGEHSRIIAGRPAIQPNYLTRGALALAHPWERPRVPPSMPRPVRLTPGGALPLPAGKSVSLPEGTATERFRGGLTVADLDGDGLLDILAPQTEPSRPPIAWWGQTSAREFVPRDVIGMPGRACSTAPAGDLDRDGDLDLLVTCSTGNLVILRDGTSWRDATPREMAFPSVAGQRATLVDIDHDGDLDVHVLLVLAQGAQGKWQAQSLAWRNDGRGAFQQSASTMGLLGPFVSDAFLWTDFDLDNAVDLVAITAEGLTLLHADRDGPHRPLPLPFVMPKATVGPPTLDLETLDADGDDDPDLVVLAGGRLTLLINESKPGAPAFRAADLGDPTAAGSALAVADLDLDGTRELLVLATSDEAGTTRGEILSAEGISIPVRIIGADGMDPEVIAAADIDGDGAVDVALRRREGEPVVLWNAAPGPGVTWARLRPDGREGRSNAQGFGAKLTVDAGSMHQRFERRSAQGTVAHVVAAETIGLGGRARVDGVTTLWPSGIQQGEAELDAGKEHAITEVDRQPSSCPMIYGWDGKAFRFLTDCFDTAPLGLWVGPGTHWAGDPDEVLRMRDGWIVPQEGVLNISIAEFLNESLLADRVAMLGVDHEATRRLVVDEAVRLAARPQPLIAWLVAGEQAVVARQGGRDVSAALVREGGEVAGWETALPWAGLAEPHALEMDLPSRGGLLVLTGSLNFSNSAGLFGASQAGVSAQPARLEVFDRGRWRELLADCGLPAGFRKDVVIELAALKLPEQPRLRITTNMQVSWDRVVLWSDVVQAPAAALRELPLLRAEKRWLGIPREVKGPQDRWREFPRDGLAGASPWIRQDGPVTPDGDVRTEIAAADDALAFVRPGEEMLIAFDDAALGAPGAGRVRTHVLVTRGWVKDATPHTAQALSILPLPRPGAELYP